GGRRDAARQQPGGTARPARGAAAGAAAAAESAPFAQLLPPRRAGHLGGLNHGPGPPTRPLPPRALADPSRLGYSPTTACRMKNLPSKGGPLWGPHDTSVSGLFRQNVTRTPLPRVRATFPRALGTARTSDRGVAPGMISGRPP